MKFARHCCQLLLLALLTPTVTLALGLGDIHLKSALNAPLDADIDLVEAEADDLANLKATLASRDTFKRLGADYPSFLGAVTLTPERMPDGRAVIHVHSASVAQEPFATLLVELDWARGHLVREYTVLLDPPVYNSQAASNAAVAAPAAGATAHNGEVQHPASAAASTAPSPATTDNGAAPGPATASSSNAAPAGAPNNPSTGATASAAASANPNASAASAAPNAASEGASARHAPGTYAVRRGDTLSTIVAQAYSGDRAARDRALVAIYRANPAAFHDNMNLLYSGSVLKLPGDSELQAIGPADARSEVQQQYAAWQGEHGGERVAGAAAADRGQLRLVAPREGAQPNAPAQGAGASASGGNAALQQRVQQLEAQLADSQRMLQLRSSELAALQARMQQQAPGHSAPNAQSANPAVTANPPAPPAPPPAATSPQTSASVSPTATPTAPATPAQTAATPPAAAQPAAPAAHPAAPRPHVSAPAPSSSVLDVLLQYWYVPAAVIALLIVMLGMRWMRARKEDAFDRSFGQLAHPVAEPVTPPPATRTERTETIPVRAMGSLRQEPSYSVEESGTHRRPSFESDEASPQRSAEPIAMEETSPTAEVPVALDQGDPLAEADFHMAYGLYDQAADLVQIAITRDPKRRDLKMKLLEVFFVWGNRERFLQTAHELAGNREQAAAGEWEKILIMGRQIAPEDPLFADGRGMAGAAKVVDLNLEGGQNRVDFDLLGEPTLTAGGASESAVELDLASALGEPSPNETTGEAAELERGIDFSLDESERPSDATGTTREMPGAMGATGSTETMRIVSGGADSETPTVEQPQIRDTDHGTIRQKIDAAARSSMSSGDQTAELAIDDLGLDLGSLAEQGDESAPVDPNAPTLLAGLDEETRRMFEGTGETHTGETVVSAQDTDATQRVAASPSRPTATGTWMFTDTDFASIAPNQQSAQTQVVTQLSPQIDAGSTSVALSALRVDELDLDLGSAESQKAHRGNGVDLDVGGPSVESAHGDTQKLSRAGTPGEVALPDLEPVTLSEVGTKLDLARAYMDMGDPEGARSILAEVMSEGSMSQKQEARRLMDALPG